ncbi:MAG: sensor histidine kinase [Gemmatimonadaceae bacterium]
MEVHTNDHAADNLPLNRREIATIVAFWAAFALLQFANRLFDAMGRPGPTNFQSGWLVVPVIDSICWALLTAPLFWLAANYSTDRVSRRQQLLVFGVVGLVVVVLVGVLGAETRSIFSAPSSNSGRGGRGNRQPPFWFGILNAVVIYFGVIAAGIARAYSVRYRARREQTVRLERQLAEARLDALRRQLDPHFLFNTLNVISSLVERDPRGVRRMISRLGGLLRFSIEGAQSPEITLRQELALLEQYLDIMQVRFQGRLETDIQADPATLDALVPTLILQPLVENAIKHGIERQREGGRIRVETLLHDDMLVLRVTDNGAGLGAPARSLDGATPAGTGVGLRNTRARLAELYGTKQHFSLAAAPGGGAVAEVSLPLHSAAPMEVVHG